MICMAHENSFANPNYPDAHISNSTFGQGLVPKLVSGTPSAQPARVWERSLAIFAQAKDGAPVGRVCFGIGAHEIVVPAHRRRHTLCKGCSGSGMAHHLGSQQLLHCLQPDTYACACLGLGFEGRT